MAATKETSVGIKLVADLRNYQTNLSKAQKQSKTFKNNVKNNMGDVKGAFTQLMRGDITALPGFFKAATSAAGGFTKGLKGVKVAMIATGVGALLVALGLAIGAVTHYFQGTEEGQIVFKKVMNNVKAYTEPVLQMFGKLGKALVQLFNGEFGAAWDTAKGAIKGTAEQIKVNKTNVEALNKAEEAYIKKKRTNILANKRLEAEIADARLKANNEDKYSAATRQKAINEAISKQKQLARNKQEELDLEIEIANTKASFGDNDIETNNQLATLEANKYEIIREQNKKLMMISETQQRINRELSAEISNRQAIAAVTVSKQETTHLSTIESRQVNAVGGTPDLDTTSLASMGAFLDGNTEKVKQFRAELGTLNETQTAVVSSVSGGFELMANNIVSSLGLASTGFEGFLGSLASTVIKLISMMLAQSLATSIAGATSSGAATGPGAVFATPVFIATAIAGVLGAFAKIPKFATGGIVGGNSFSGDKILARLNSGEEVLTQNDPRHRNNNSSGNTINEVPYLLDTEISADKLRFIMRRADLAIAKRT